MTTSRDRYIGQGREYSWKTGLYYCRARWYDPHTCRWLSNDPIGISGGLNQYAALNSNQVNFTDPCGLDMHKVRFDGKIVRIDDTKITPEGVALEIKQMTRTVELLQKVSEGRPHSKSGISVLSPMPQQEQTRDMEPNASSIFADVLSRGSGSAHLV